MKSAICFLVALVGCAERAEPTAQVAQAPVSAAPVTAAAPATAAAPRVVQTAEGVLTEVTEPNLVCMVNNQFMGREQIPVEVEGVTYFGCCDMCKSRLAHDPSSRLGTDPVSGRSVDKAKAVMARTASGKMYYFENEANFLAFGQR